MKNYQTPKPSKPTTKKVTKHKTKKPCQMSRKYPLVIKHGLLENPNEMENHLFLWSIFQQAMFDDTGG